MRETQKRRSGILSIVIVATTFLVASSCGEPRATAPNGSSSQLLNPGPNLVECPANETATTIGFADPILGGIVELDGSNITIPSGAISTPRPFQLTIPAGRYVELDVSALDPVTLLPLDSFLFDNPVNITIDYSRCTRNLSQTPLHVYHIDPLTKELLEDMGGVDDKVSQRITFTTGHLSGYALAD